MAPASTSKSVQPARKRAAVTATVRLCGAEGGSESSVDSAKTAEPAAPAQQWGHPVAETMGGYCRAITLHAGGLQGPSYGLGPGEAKGDRSRARQLALAARAAGGDVSDEHPFPHGVPPKPTREAEAARLRKLAMLKEKPIAGLALTDATLPAFAKVVTLQAGGPQAMSFGLGPGEHKGERAHSRVMHRGLAAGGK
jgi:hypothetical protein